MNSISCVTEGIKCKTMNYSWTICMHWSYSILSHTYEPRRSEKCITMAFNCWCSLLVGVPLIEELKCMVQKISMIHSH